MTDVSRRVFTPDDLLECYRTGIFPMADSRDDPSIFFVDPEHRGIIPLDGLHISRSLKKVLKRQAFTVTFDRCFPEIMVQCAAQTDDRPETWINEGIKFLYGVLHQRGQAHSVEVWKEAELVGGLYGVSIGAAFFGESMFSRATNASKVALVHLVERLNIAGYELLDTQFITPHLASMGAVEISRSDYHLKLAKALKKEAEFTREVLGSEP